MWITIAVAGIAFHAPVGWSLPGLIAPTNSTGQVGGDHELPQQRREFFAPVVTGIIVQRTDSFYSALVTARCDPDRRDRSYTVVLGHIDKVPDPVGSTA